jgi:ATP-dependent DNA helicase PIF1
MPFLSTSDVDAFSYRQENIYAGTGLKVDGDMFDELESVARQVRGNSKPFGGIQLIVCGDFLQLPPVGKGDEVKKFAFESKSWKRCMQQCIELKEVRRQSDPTFIDLLRRVRFGVCTAEDVQTMRETESNDVEFGGIEATQLCTHVKDAEAINISKLRQLTGVSRIFNARDDVGGDYRATKTLDSACRAPAKLELKLGAQVMLVKNIAVQRGLANGSRGVVAGWSSQGLPIVKFVSGLQETMRLESWSVGIGAGAVLSFLDQSFVCLLAVSHSSSTPAVWLKVSIRVVQ